jgi:hypothetical protein
MKKIGLLLSLLTIGACASFGPKNNQYAAYDQATFQEWSKPFVHVPLTRAPSSEIVGRPTYFWEADSLKIPLTANATINQNYNIRFNQYSVYNTKEKVERIVPQVEVRWEQVQNAVLVCDEQSGTGKSPLWNAFYSAPAAKKVATLAAAIEGVGTVSATGLVKNGYFHSKPRNWRDFQDEIQRAARAEVITKSVEHQILYRYRSENMAKLGYNTQLSGVCRMEIETYYSPREVVVNKKVIVEEIVPRRDLISTETRQYAIRISGQSLQPFENEMLIFSFNRDSNQVTLAQAAYNNYSISFDGRLITVIGISRKSVKLPAEVLPAGATLESSGGQARFTAPLNRKYIPKSVAEGHLLISLRVHSCKKGLFGGCSLTGRDEQIQPTVVKDAAVSNGLVNLSFALSPGRKYWVEYWVNTANSPWYTNNVVKAMNSPEI